MYEMQASMLPQMPTVHQGSGDLMTLPRCSFCGQIFFDLCSNCNRTWENESDPLVFAWVDNLMGNLSVQMAIGQQLEAWKEEIITYEEFRWHMQNNLEGMI